MRAARKPLSPAEKMERGTLRPSREIGTVELISPSDLPQQPDWLTESGREIWLDDIGRVSAVRGATEFDCDLFANYCNLQGGIVLAWRSGTMPPITALMEARKMQEMLRIAGPSSRVVKVSDGQKPTGNPFIKVRT